MHFKIGPYEHQSAGGLDGLVTPLVQNPEIVKDGLEGIGNISIIVYETDFGIIGDPANEDPKTRQSADHSMAFIVGRMLQKAMMNGSLPSTYDDAWKALMLLPQDYGRDASNDSKTRALMQSMTFAHGGPDNDAKYPDGIPTSIDIKLKSGKTFRVLSEAQHVFDTSVGWWQLFDKSESDFIMIMSCVWIPLCGVYRSGSPST